MQRTGGAREPAHAALSVAFAAEGTPQRHGQIRCMLLACTVGSGEFDHDYHSGSLASGACSEPGAFTDEGGCVRDAEDSL